jgi:hypothetical protein
MELDVDTFLTVIYCVCDEVYQREIAPKLGARPGARPKLSESEVLALAVVGQWHGQRCERCFLRYVRRHWHGYFPRLTSQSAFNRRARHLWAALCVLGPAVAREVSRLLGRAPTYQVWDGVPVPLMRQCRGEQHRLFGTEADVGYGGSDRTEYYGMHRLADANDQGTIDGFVVGPAATSEYWLAEALLRWRQDPAAPAPTPEQLAPILGPTHQKGGRRVGPTGPIGPRLAAGGPDAGASPSRPVLPPILADLGFTGRRWRAHWRAAYHTAVLTKADYDALTDPTERHRAKRGFNRRRHEVETVFSVLADRFGSKFPRSRTHWGPWTRLAAKVACYNLAVYVNYLFHRPTFSLFNPLD